MNIGRNTYFNLKLDYIYTDYFNNTVISHRHNSETYERRIYNLKKNSTLSTGIGFSYFFESNFFFAIFASVGLNLSEKLNIYSQTFFELGYSSRKKQKDDYLVEFNNWKFSYSFGYKFDNFRLSLSYYPDYYSFIQREINFDEDFTFKVSSLNVKLSYKM